MYEHLEVVLSHLIVGCEASRIRISDWGKKNPSLELTKALRAGGHLAILSLKLPDAALAGLF